MLFRSRLKISQWAAGSPARGWLPRGSCSWLSPAPQPPLWGLGAQQALLQHRGAWEALADEPGPVPAPGSPGTPGPGLPSSAREMDASISLIARVPAQPPALHSHEGKERVLPSLHPPPRGGLRANKRQQRNHARRAAQVSLHPTALALRCAGQGFSQEQVSRQPVGGKAN